MILVDAMMLIHRCYRKLDFLQNSSGKPTGMEFGFLRSLESLAKKYDRPIILAWEGGNNRREIYPEYKANREVDEGFNARVSAFTKIANSLYSHILCRGCEADEAIASYCKRNETVLIYSNDKDLMQLISPKITVLKSHDSKIYEWDEYKFQCEFMIPPRGMVFWLTMLGDAVDNIPGVPRLRKAELRAAINEACTMDDYITQRQVFWDFPWLGKSQKAVKDFIDSGQYDRNYKLVQLQDVAEHEFYLPQAADVGAWLKEMEIYSLGICKEYGLSGEEEF